MEPSDRVAGCTGIELVLCGLERRFGRRLVFTDINATITCGEVLSVSGPNGSGKSTLLRIIAGLQGATRGRVLFCDGNVVLDASTRRAVSGYVAPDFALYARLSGAENLRFLASLYGVGNPDTNGLLARVGLAGREDDSVGSYSSGMRQRLKYAAALLHKPALLLLDEPTANLDSDGVCMVQQVIAAQRIAGITVIATNEAEEVSWGDRVIRLGS
jgi:heme exporter protein A